MSNLDDDIDAINFVRKKGKNTEQRKNQSTKTKIKR